MDWAEEEESPQKEEERKISPEELYRILVSNNIITEKDLKARVEEELPILDNSVKATSYMLENHRSLFKLFKQNGAYYEAVKLARRLVEARVITQKEEPYHYTPYYFDKGDRDTMKCIDAKLKKWYPKNVIPTKYPFIRKIKVELKPESCLDAKVDKSEELRINPEFVTVSAHLRKNHAYLFKGFDCNYIFRRASQITARLAKKGVFSKQEKKYNNTPYYFDKDDKDTMNAIDDAINRLYTEGLREPKERKKIKDNFC